MKHTLTCSEVTALWKVQAHELLAFFPLGLQPYLPTGEKFNPPRERHESYRSIMRAEEAYKLASECRNRFTRFLGDQGHDPDKPLTKHVQEQLTQLDTNVVAAWDRFKTIKEQAAPWDSWKLFVMPRSLEELEELEERGALEDWQLEELVELRQIIYQIERCHFETNQVLEFLKPEGLDEEGKRYVGLFHEQASQSAIKRRKGKFPEKTDRNEVWDEVREKSEQMYSRGGITLDAIADSHEVGEIFKKRGVQCPEFTTIRKKIQGKGKPGAPRKS